MSKKRKNRTEGTAAKIFQTIIYWPTYLLLKFFVHYEVYGQENLEGLADGPIIFASNHASLVDGPICGAIMPRDTKGLYPSKFFPIRFLVLKRFFGWRYFLVALYVRLNGSIKIYRHSGHKVSTVLREAIKALRHKEHLWIFPEGRITVDGKLQKGRKGITFLHQRTGAPIVPVAIRESFKILSFKTLLRTRKVVVVIGKPIYSLDGISLQKGTNKIMRRIAKLLKKPLPRKSAKKHIIKFNALLRGV